MNSDAIKPIPPYIGGASASESIPSANKSAHEGDENEPDDTDALGEGFPHFRPKRLLTAGEGAISRG